MSFLILSLLFVLAFAVWWSVENFSALSSNDHMQTGAQVDTRAAPLKEAEDIKYMLEARDPTRE